MRHQLQPATSADVAYLATLLADAPASLDWPEKESSHRLLEACAFSAQIWAARRLSDGRTSAIWGVTPRLDNPDVGYVWMLAATSFEEDPRELSLLCRLVLAEMLEQFPRLEQHIAAERHRTLELLRSVGFTIGEAARGPGSAAAVHHVWLESNQLPHPANQSGRLLVH